MLPAAVAVALASTVRALASPERPPDGRKSRTRKSWDDVTRKRSWHAWYNCVCEWAVSRESLGKALEGYHKIMGPLDLPAPENRPSC